MVPGDLELGQVEVARGLKGVNQLACNLHGSERREAEEGHLTAATKKLGTHKSQYLPLRERMRGSLVGPSVHLRT